MQATLVRLHAEGMLDGSVRAGHPLLAALSVVSQPIYLTLIAPLAKSLGGLDLSDPKTRTMVVDHVTGFVRAGLESRMGHAGGGPQASDVLTTVED